MEIKNRRIHAYNIVEENVEKITQLFSCNIVKCKQMLMGGGVKMPF